MAGPMRLLYICLAHCLAPIAFLREVWRATQHPRYRHGFAERFGFGSRTTPGTIWVHAVSVGEVQAIGPLLRRLQRDWPARPLVVTASTATGRERAVTLYAGIADVRYLPYDIPLSVGRFLGQVQPAVGVVLETELWPTLLTACRRRGVPLIVASARLSERSARRYGAVPRWSASLLGGAGLWVAAQTEADRDRFLRLGAAAARTSVCGNIKFDQAVPDGLLTTAAQFRAQWGDDRPVWVAGSTHAGEEQVVLAAHREVLTAFPGALLVLAPRHPPRFDAVATLIRRAGFAVERRTTSATAVSLDVPVLLLDTLGELWAAYAVADMAFVGGSLVPIGGHNLLEPLSVRCPTLTGPSHHNDARTAQLLLDAGAVRQVESAHALAMAVVERLSNPASAAPGLLAAAHVLAQNRGATGRLAATIAGLIPRPDPVSAPTPDGPEAR